MQQLEATNPNFTLDSSLVTPSDAAHLSFDYASFAEFQRRKPFLSDNRYFRHVRISALAALKMLSHAVAGGNLEIMGVLIGSAANREFFVHDVIPLPVTGTETRVNAGDQAMTSLFGLKGLSEDLGDRRPVIGWYHSHPGYGPWLSGIDIKTQRLNQGFQDPYVALVIDPLRSIAAGRVCIGAFRVLETDEEELAAANAKRAQAAASAAGSGSAAGAAVPMAKLADYGKWADQYYELDTSFFHTETDARFLAAYGSHWTAPITADSAVTLQLRANAVTDLCAALSAEKASAAAPSSHGYRQAPGLGAVPSATATLLRKRADGIVADAVGAALGSSVRHLLFTPPAERSDRVARFVQLAAQAQGSEPTSK
jgi:COP9 signalosome complex subunit 5